MRIAMRCEKCGTLFMQEEDDLCLEIDFKLKRMSFICRNKNCKHENIFDMGNWQKQQLQSPLPRIRTM
jgi:hypothetical protein